MSKLKKGFTLVELIVVIMLMGVITTAIVMIIRPSNTLYANISNKSGEENACITLTEYLNGELRYATGVIVLCNDGSKPASGTYGDCGNFIVLSNELRSSSKKGARGYAGKGLTSNFDKISPCVSEGLLDEYDFQFNVSGNTSTGVQSMTLGIEAHPMKVCHTDRRAAYTPNVGNPEFEPNMDTPYNYSETFQFLNLQNEAHIGKKVIGFSPDVYDQSAGDTTIWIFYQKPADAKDINDTTTGGGGATPPGGGTTPGGPTGPTTPDGTTPGGPTVTPPDPAEGGTTPGGETTPGGADVPDDETTPGGGTDTTPDSSSNTDSNSTPSSSTPSSSTPSSSQPDYNRTLTINFMGSPSYSNYSLQINGGSVLGNDTNVNVPNGTTVQRVATINESWSYIRIFATNNQQVAEYNYNNIPQSGLEIWIYKGKVYTTQPEFDVSRVVPVIVHFSAVGDQYNPPVAIGVDGGGSDGTKGKRYESSDYRGQIFDLSGGGTTELAFTLEDGAYLTIKMLQGGSASSSWPMSEHRLNAGDYINNTDLEYIEIWLMGGQIYFQEPSDWRYK